MLASSCNSFTPSKPRRGRINPLARPGLLACLAISVGASVCSAQSVDPIKLDADPIVVTVSGKALPLSAVSAAVTVLSQKEISASHATNLAELLQNVPALHLSQAGGKGAFSSATMRGGDPNFILVLVDGVPVHDPNNSLGGAFDFSSMSLLNVDRIEIARGPLSTMYGTDAMSGAINVITKHAPGEQSLMEASFGRFGSTDVQAVHSGSARAFSYSAGASYARAGEQVEKDEFSLKTISFNWTLQIKGNRTLNWSSRLAARDLSGFPSNGGGSLYSILRDPENRRTRTALGVLAYRQEIRPWWTARAQVDVFDSNERLAVPAILDRVPPGPNTVPSLSSRSNLLRTRFEIANEMEFGQGWGGVFAFGRSVEEGTNHGTLGGFIPASFSSNRSTMFLTGELLYGGPDLNVTVGARADFVDSFATKISPRIGLVYSPESPTRIRFSWGRAFRLPSFFAVGNPLVGNLLLRPEHSRSIDAGIHRSFQRIPSQIGMTFFDESYQDLIDFSPSVFKLVNRSRAIGRGVEAEGTVSNSAISVRAHATFVHSKLTSSDEPLRDRPRWRGGVQLQWTPTGDWSLRFDTRWVGSRADLQVPVPEKATAPRYSTSSLALDYAFGHGAVFLKINNLFDQDFQEFVGFPNPGVWFTTGLRIHR